MAYKIFVSSSHKDIDLARDVARRLEESGVEAHMISEPAFTENLNTRIIRSLSNADEVLVILTEKSVVSPWIMFELGASASLRKRMTLVGVGVNANKLPLIVRDMNFIKYPDLPKYIVELKRRTKAA